METRIRQIWDRAHVLLAGAPHDLVADRGRVNCPYSSGDIDVDACLSCPRLDFASVDTEGNGTVRCLARPA